MTPNSKAAMWAGGSIFALMLGLIAGNARAQGTVVFVVPQQPIFYAPLEGSTDIDLKGDGTIDYTLISHSGETDLRPYGQNSLLVVPELPPDYGSFVAALSQGDAVNSTPSSVNPVFAWHDSSSDPFNPVIAAFSTAGSLGYFFDGIHYVGLRFEYGGSLHYGWMEIDCFSPSVPSGQVLAWAYETRPDTPIEVGEVPEPSTGALFALAGIVVVLRRDSRR